MASMELDPLRSPSMSNMSNPYTIAAQVLIEGLVHILKIFPEDPRNDLVALEVLGHSVLEKMVSICFASFQSV